MSSDKPCFDMHVHTKYSGDGRLEPAELIKICRKSGLSGVAVTDHNTIAGGIETSKIVGDVEVIVGAEIMTDFGEVIGYHLTQEIRSRRIGEVIDEIKAQGGYLSVPHPFDTLRKGSLDQGKLREITKYLDFIEACNARSFWFCNKRAGEYAARNAVPVLGGSDAHMGFEVGRCFTVFKDFEKMEMDHIEANVNLFYPFYPLVRTKFYKIFRL